MGRDEYVRVVVAEQGNREAMKYLRRKREGLLRQICLMNTKGGGHRPIRSGEREETRVGEEERVPNKAEGRAGLPNKAGEEE